MNVQLERNGNTLHQFFAEANSASEFNSLKYVYPLQDLTTSMKVPAVETVLHQNRDWRLQEFLAQFQLVESKQSFLVFKNNKYITVPTERIAFFYVRHETSTIMCFDQQEYPVNYSLGQIQSLLNNKSFYRVNRQYLISFPAIKEVEHYFARKLLVNLSVPVKDQLLISKEKATSFLNWMENR